jgi:hypothetical protein
MSYNFAKATVTETGTGEKSASVSCLNGATASTGLSYPLSANATYFDGEAIGLDEEILFPIRTSNNTVDEGNIFPYNATTGDPQRIGGGIGKGNIIEEDGSTTNLGVEVDWINGLNAAGVISEIASGALGSLGAGDIVWFLMHFDENDVAEVLAATESEGTCGDVAAGEPQFTFGESVTA